MKSSQTGVITAFAVLLAVTVILFGRLITPAPSPRQVERMTSLTPGAQIAYISSVGRDGAQITLARVNQAGHITSSFQQRVRFQSLLPRLDVTNNGLLLMHETNPGNATATVRNIYDYSVQLNLSNCQFTAISPNGQKVACATATEVKVSPTHRLQWSSVRGTLSDAPFGAPRLFNETIVIRQAINADTIDISVVSLVNNAPLAYLDPEKDYIFDRSGSKIVWMVGRNLMALDVSNDPENPQMHRLPAELSDHRVQPVALSNSGHLVLLYTQSPCMDRAQMAVWDLETDALTWLSLIDEPGRATGEFDPTGQMVVMAIGDNVYLASLADGSAYWVGTGRNPVWVIR
jgi:hypothetical protein